MGRYTEKIFDSPTSHARVEHQFGLMQLFMTKIMIFGYWKKHSQIEIWSLVVWWNISYI